MIHAYDKLYLEKARTSLGRMLDYMVNTLGMEITSAFDLFLSSGVAARFEVGEYTVTAGMSGVELAYEVLERSGASHARVPPDYAAGRSEEYWTGWALAYYQWQTGLRFTEIVRFVPIQDIRALYVPYHEMDIRQFADQMNILYRAAKPETNLKLLRQRAGLSQRQLSALSNVPVRTIQQYEQRQKQINKAQAEYLLRLSRALCCEIEDLFERVP